MALPNKEMAKQSFIEQYVLNMALSTSAKDSHPQVSAQKAAEAWDEIHSNDVETSKPKKKNCNEFVLEYATQIMNAGKDNFVFMVGNPEKVRVLELDVAKYGITDDVVLVYLKEVEK